MKRRIFCNGMMRLAVAATAMAALFSLAACQTPIAPIKPVYGPTNPPMTHNYCAITGLRPDKEAKYRQLHANVWPAVRTALRRANIRNYNIYVTELNGRKILVSTFDYVGKNPERDFAALANNPVIKSQWSPLMGTSQYLLKGTPSGFQWLPLEQVMHID